MRKLVAFLLMATVAATGFAATLSQYTQEIVVNGNFDPDTAADTHYDLDVAYGYFIADYLEVGGEVFWSDDDFITTSGLGAFAEYNFDLGTEVVPFVGASIDYANAEIDEFDSDENAIVLGVRGGVKCFIAENIAISGQAVIEQATEDIYAEQDGVSDNDFRLELGMRFFIGP